MVDLAPGVPIPLPPQDNSTLQSFGKGMALGLEAYIDKRMKQKALQEAAEMEIKDYAKKKVIDIYKDILDQTVALNVNAPNVPTSIPVPQMGLPQSLSLAPQGMPILPQSEAQGLPQGAIPQLPPTSEQDIRQNVLSGLAQGNLPTGMGKSWNLSKAGKPSTGIINVNPKDENEKKFFEDTFKGYRFTVGKDTPMAKSTYEKGIFKTKSRDYSTMSHSELNSYIGRLQSNLNEIAPYAPYDVPEEQKEEYYSTKTDLDAALAEQKKRSGIRKPAENKEKMIRVIEKATKLHGSIPESEFDPNKYTRE